MFSQVLMNQQNLTKQLESKTAELERQLLEASMGSASVGDSNPELEDESLYTVQAEQDTLIKDLQSQVHLRCVLGQICAEPASRCLALLALTSGDAVRSY
jgi:hypothetical protein